MSAKKSKNSPADKKSIETARKILISEIVTLRQKKGLTQKDLEALTGVRQSSIARIENGSIIPRIETIIKLLLPLGKTLRVVPIRNREKIQD